MTTKILSQNCLEAIVTHTAINEIILGTFVTMDAGFVLYFSLKYEDTKFEFRLYYYYFLLVVGILSVFTGSLLFHSVREKKKKGILTCLLITLVVMFAAKLISGISVDKVIKKFSKQNAAQ
ncbi:uncharacterized protein LOC135140914 [Zophobas morio]|uniref:uncharacterized protein LOC135140914 n=1 Tax=Zophobas morio TaxID=2755281 RepID=UPI0030828C94